MPASTDPAKTGPGRGRRVLNTETSAPNVQPFVTVDQKDAEDAPRVFVERSDEAVLKLVHVLNELNYIPVVTFLTDGTKSISV